MPLDKRYSSSMSSRTIERSIPRRGLSREEAAIYLGVSPSKFDELRRIGQVGAPRLIGSRKVWDVRELDYAFDSFPYEEGDESRAADWTVAV